MLAALVAACGAGSGGPAAPGSGGAVTPGAGVVSGRYLDRARPGAVPVPVAGVPVGLFSHSFVPGANAMAGTQGAGGEQVAAGVTGPDGRFVLRRVPSGRWFLTRTDGRVVPTGQWVTVSPAVGAAADLVGCSLCPPGA